MDSCSNAPYPRADQKTRVLNLHGTVGQSKASRFYCRQQMVCLPEGQIWLATGNGKESGGWLTWKICMIWGFGTIWLMSSSQPSGFRLASPKVCEGPEAAPRRHTRRTFLLSNRSGRVLDSRHEPVHLFQTQSRGVLDLRLKTIAHCRGICSDSGTSGLHEIKESAAHLNQIHKHPTPPTPLSLRFFRFAANFSSVCNAQIKSCQTVSFSSLFLLPPWPCLSGLYLDAPLSFDPNT